jgi:hypothetical protein
MGWQLRSVWLLRFGSFQLSSRGAKDLSVMIDKNATAVALGRLGMNGCGIGGIAFHHPVP